MNITQKMRAALLRIAAKSYDEASERLTYDELASDYRRFRPALFT